jgi:ubiquinone/menaquinone biosynthesis C-methylase UbiE
MMANWSYHLMRMSWKVVDLFTDQAKLLDDFNILAGWTVIDYGCGPGRYLKKASEMVGPGGKVYAVDIHDIAINCSRSLIEKNDLKNVSAVKARHYFVPIPENTADLIYVLDVFHMIARPDLFLKELHRLVKPEGILILDDGHQKRARVKEKVLLTHLWKIVEENKRYLKMRPIHKLAL